jgi:hypothetical protein
MQAMSIQDTQSDNVVALPRRAPTAPPAPTVEVPEAPDLTDDQRAVLDSFTRAVDFARANLFTMQHYALVMAVTDPEENAKAYHTFVSPIDTPDFLMTIYALQKALDNRMAEV